MKRDASRHLPAWTERDIEAVTVLLAVPAPTEQIALARIEGLASFPDYEASRKLLRIQTIARRGLGIA